jgi:hypothetical protein
MSTFVLIYSASKEHSNNETLPEWAGFLLIGASSIFWGSNYLPVKQYETGKSHLSMYFNL